MNVMKKGYQKMIGSGKIKAVANTYSLLSTKLNDTKINVNTMLTLGVEIKDGLSSSGMIVIELPRQILAKNLSNITVNITSSITSSGKINSNPTIKFYPSNQTIYSYSLNTSYSCASITGCILLTNLATNTINVQNLSL